MADLFDLVKAAPPPSKVRPSPKRTNPTRTPSPASSLPAPISSPLSDNSLNGEDTVSMSPTKRAIVRIKRFSLQESPNTSKTLESNLDLLNARSCLTKTKAQQKQFDDELPVTSGSNEDEDSIVKPKNNDADDNAKKCCVRLKRISQTDIDDYTKPKKIKRGRPKKCTGMNNFCSPLPFTKAASLSPTKTITAQKRKIDSSEPMATVAKKIAKSSPPIHFKLTPQKNPKLATIKVRKSTPPPASLTHGSKSGRGKTELIRRHGVKVFRSFVRMERCKHPLALSFEANERARKSRRPNLSVSFRDAVEIIGQSDDVGSSVPTRLTKIENGKVVEYVALDQANATMPPPVTSTTGSGAVKKHRKKRESGDKPSSSRRSSKISRHSGDRLPLSGMARLRIDDDAPNNEDEENDEYIVPNELPVSMSTLQNSTKTKDNSAIQDAPPQQEANNEQQSTRVALKSPLPPPSTKESTPTLSATSDKDKDKETSLPHTLESREQQNHDELFDNIFRSEEFTKASTMGPSPRRPLKSATPLKELQDQDIKQNDEATNVASTNISSTKSAVDDEATPTHKQAVKLRSPSVDSETSFCSAKDILEQMNGATNEEMKLTSTLPDINVIDIKTEELQPTEPIVATDEKEAAPEQPISEKINGLDQDEKVQLTSDDGDSESAIMKLVVEDSVEESEKADESNTQSSDPDGAIARPKLNVVMLNPPTITKKSPTPTNDNEDLPELDDTLNIQEDDDELCLNLREQVSDFTAATGSLVEDLMKALDP